MEDIKISQGNGKQAIGYIDLAADNSIAKIDVTNGETPITVNGVAGKTPGASEIQPNTHGPSHNAPSHPLVGLIDGLPPELPHISAGFYSLGELIGRVTQESFNGLTEVMDEMSRMRIPIRPVPGHAVTNGTTTHNLPDDASSDSPANQEKKRKFLEWSQTTRERFVKLLVLTTWSSKMGDLRKLMDVLAYLRESDQTYWQVANSVGEIKRRMYPFKLPAPNLPHAAEVLSRGTAAWMGDFYGYLPRKNLTPEETLKILKNMDVLLNTRLILHEDLPLHLRTYEIKNGRATFKLPYEFELDVTLASEDLSRQLYFIDLRFLFDPAPDLGNTRVRERIEMKVNELLGTVGLTSACDFLRNFTLTHKITTWRKQALELQSSYWNKLLRVDQIHRSLIINYWYGSTMPKSWIEIGVNSGKTKNGKAVLEGQARPRLGLKWSRAAKKVPENESPSLDVQHLSVEGLLMKTSAMHISYLLQTIERSIQQLLGGNTSRLQMTLNRSATEPCDCSLELRLGLSMPRITLSMESISGSFFISPPSKRADRVTWELNQMGNPGTDAGTKLLNFVYSELQDWIQKQVGRRGWSFLQAKSWSLPQPKEVFGKEVQLLMLFLPRGWETTSFAIAVTIDATAEAWWTVKLIQHQSQDGQRQYRISLARRLRTPRIAISQVQLVGIEEAAICSITYQSAAESLKTLGIGHQLERPSSINDTLHNNQQLESMLSSLDITTNGVPRTDHQQPNPSMTIRTSHLIPDLSKPSPIFGESSTIRYTNFHAHTGTVCLTAAGSLKNAKRIAEKLAMIEDDDLEVAANGSFKLSLKAKLGASFVTPLIRALRSLAQLRTFVAVIDRRRLDLREISTRSLTFAYPSDPSKPGNCNLLCTLNQAATSPAVEKEHERKRGPSTAYISISMPSSNPHLRLTTILESYLNANVQTGFQALVNGLALSLPLCTAFVEIQTGALFKHPKPPSASEDAQEISIADAVEQTIYLNNPTIHVHRPDSWKIVYSNPASVWMLVLRPWRSKLQWQLTEVVHQPPAGQSQQQQHQHPIPFSRTPTGGQRDDVLVKDLQTLFRMGNKGSDWRAYKNLIVAEMGTGIADALLQVNAILRRHRDTNHDSAGEKLADTKIVTKNVDAAESDAAAKALVANGSRTQPTTNKSGNGGSRANVITLD